MPLVDIGKILGRAGLIRARCGFFEAEPPYSTNVITEVCFPDVSVTPQNLPPRVIEMVEVQGTRRRLYYNERVPNELRRVGIAHGLHHLLDDLREAQGLRECNEGARMLELVGALPVSLVELGCDLFAGEVLVPFAVLHRYAPDDLTASTPETRGHLKAEVHRLASRFQVPEAFMAWRLHDLAALRRTSFLVG